MVTCCVNVTWPLSPEHPFICSVSLSLSPVKHTPSTPHTDTHNPPCWGSKWSKITHSATQSLLCLALGTDCFIPWLFFLSFPAPDFLLVLCFFSYHHNSTKTRASDGELLDLSHCVVVLCCVAGVGLVEPHTSREVCCFGHLCLVGIGIVVCVLQALVRAFVSVRFTKSPSRLAAAMHHVKIQKKKSVFTRSAKTDTVLDAALNRQKYFL